MGVGGAGAKHQAEQGNSSAETAKVSKETVPAFPVLQTMSHDEAEKLVEIQERMKDALKSIIAGIQNGETKDAVQQIANQAATDMVGFANP